jgi:hypothetical protein
MKLLPFHFAAITVLFLLNVPLSLHAQSSGGSGGSSGSGAGSSGGSSSNGGSSGGGSGGSGLQSESKALIFQSLSECVGDLVEKMRHSVTGQNDPSKPAFALSLPFLPDDAASCWEFKQQLLDLDKKLLAFQASLQAPSAPTPYEVMYGGFVDDLSKARADFNNINSSFNGGIPGGGSSSTPSASSSSTPSDIKELGGAASSATAIGAIASTISGLLTIAESFHSTFTTSAGALGLDQPTVNSLVVNELINRGYRVYDFSQYYIPEGDFTSSTSSMNPPAKLEQQDILGLMGSLGQEIDQIDQNYQGVKALPDVSSQNSGGTLADSLKAIYEALDAAKKNLLLLQDASKQEGLHGKDEQGKPITHLDPADANIVTDDINKLQTHEDYLKSNFAKEYKTYTDGLSARKKLISTILKAATNFQQVILGAIAPKYPLSSASGSDGGGGGNSTSTITLNSPDGKAYTITYSSSGGDSSSTGSQGQGGGSSTAPQASPINYIEKFALLEHNLKIMEKQHVKIIAAHVMVGDSTQTHVSRQIIEDYVALSNRAIVELQVFDPLQGSYLYSDHSESDHQYVYFPSRIRDGAENKWKDRDVLSHSSREVPYNDLEWFSRYDWAKKEAAETNRPILVYSDNSDAQPLGHGPEERIFADTNFKQYAAQKLVLLRVDARGNSIPDNPVPADEQVPTPAAGLPRLDLIFVDKTNGTATTSTGTLSAPFDQQTDVDDVIDMIQEGIKKHAGDLAANKRGH